MDVAMSTALVDMLAFFFDVVVAFLSSQPGIYLWALILCFYLVGILGRLLSLPSIVMDSRLPSLGRFRRISSSNSRIGGNIPWRQAR